MAPACASSPRVSPKSVSERNVPERVVPESECDGPERVVPELVQMTSHTVIECVEPTNRDEPTERAAPPMGSCFTDALVLFLFLLFQLFTKLPY